MSVEPNLKDHDFYLDYEPFRRPYEEVCPLTKLPAVHSRYPPVRIPFDVETGRLRESFSFPPHNPAPASISYLSIPAVAFTRQFVNSRVVKIVWSRYQVNTIGMPLIKHSDSVIGEGDYVFCEEMYGNGRIERIEGWHGRYTIVSAVFSNTAYDPKERIVAVPFTRIRLSRMGRIRAIWSFICRPFVTYKECLF
jgi:hypothetical protein